MMFSVAIGERRSHSHCFFNQLFIQGLLSFFVSIDFRAWLLGVLEPPGLLSCVPGAVSMDLPRFQAKERFGIRRES